MLDEIRDLLVLQDRDKRLQAILKDLEKLPQEESRAKSKLSGDQAAVDKATEALRNSELEVKKIELDAETRRTTIKRLKLQQFETRKNDEFQALGHEVIRYEKELDGFETRELELMEETDGLRAKLAEANAALAKTRGLVDEDLASVAERKRNLLATQAEVKAERDKLAAAAPANILPLYERLLKTKGGIAISPMHEGRCGGCHMKLIAGTVIKVQAEKEVAQCEDCGRILYPD
ncbi:MAG: C4-type zinc ribbon domain-containing protein [Luteolibacter sp.]